MNTYISEPLHSKPINVRLIEVIHLPKLTRLNEYINAERKNKFIAAKIKNKETELCAWHFAGKKYKPPIAFSFVWHENDNRYDFDNIAFAKKFIFDGMQMAGAIKNDSRKYVNEIIFEYVIKSDIGTGVEVGIWEILDE